MEKVAYHVECFVESENAWAKYSSPLDRDIADIHFSVLITKGIHTRIIHKGKVIKEGNDEVGGAKDAG